MATIDDELIIDLESDEPPASASKPQPRIGPTGVRPSALAKGDPKPAAPSPDADRIAALERERDEAAARAADATARLTREAAARAEAEKTAGDRTEQAMRAHWAKLHSDHAQITGAISQTQSDADAAQREYVAAMEAGETSRAAEAQRRMSKAEAALVQLETGRIASEDEIARTKRLYESYDPRPAPKKEAEPPAQPEPQRAPTPDEWIDSTRNVLGDDGVKWLRDNKQFATDPKMNRKLLRFADDYADDHGQGALKSKEFMEALNAKFFPKADDMADDDGAEVDTADEAEPPQQRKAQPSAPVSRTSPARSAQMASGGKVRLSGDEQATAVQMYPDLDRNAALKRYAANKARAIADGHYNSR